MPKKAFPVRFLGLLLAAVLSACSGGSQAALNRFPIGLYGVDDPRLIKALSESGFDSFHTYKTDPALLAALAKEAGRRGMRMVVSPESLMAGPAAAAWDWPVDAWYLEDEPDVSHIPPEELQKTSERARLWDPRRPQTFVIGEGAPAKSYGRIADILMLDWYPVPHLPLDSVADQIDLARQSLPEDKPLWAVLQAFDWRDSAQRDPKKPRVGRFPTREEIRFMSYLAVLHGARGLFYYTFQKPNGRNLFDFPEQWQALAAAATEMGLMRTIFERGTPIPPPSELDPKFLEFKAWRYHGRDYVIVLNRKKGFYERIPDRLLSKDWRPLFEARRDPRKALHKISGYWYLAPYRVMVFESRIQWADLFRP